MKSLAKTTKMTPDESAKFIIQGTTSARKKKRLAQKVKKRKQQQTLPTPEDLLQAQRHERRKLAHDRLVARQAKITLKKQKVDNDVVDVAPSSSDEDIAEVEPETRDDQPPPPLVVTFNDVASSTGLVASTFEVDDRISRINAHLCNVQAEDNLRVVFRNFYCIMTSFYERTKTDLTTTSTSKHIIQNRDVAIRFQCKLYTVWKNVMHDYTTRQSLLCWQKVNHFAGAKALTRKDMLKKSLQRYAAMGDKMKASFDIAPETFILPNEYIPFVQAFKRRADAIGSSKNFWIMKPVALSRGRGISLLNDLGQVTYGQAVILQKYIENPLLLDGFKAFFYNEGFVRICTHRYNTDSEDMNDLFMHLTNSSIQKHGHMDQVSDNPVNNAEATEAGGTKASLAYLWSRLAAAHAPVDTIKAAILDVIVKSLVAGEDSIPFQVNSFDLYGYDILLDESFRPWLIESNSSPSMGRDNSLDYVIKDALIYDTMRLVRPLHFDRAALVSVLNHRAHDLAQ
ncbi:hypothetical protein DYB34_008223 [Aphanomyces astaci]|uniref:Tubulin--tyrosine ligase-like protein 9 n=1 Tax=Aphanomyces astaci TaxID=112090 RepID=A0A418C631_APHAT|nr:hypothetical protein DYB34_008223 [Aphanomyces astaci]